jgi:hypothetical protein
VTALIYDDFYLLLNSLIVPVVNFDLAEEKPLFCVFDINMYRFRNTDCTIEVPDHFGAYELARI